MLDIIKQDFPGLIWCAVSWADKGPLVPTWSTCEGCGHSAVQVLRRFHNRDLGNADWCRDCLAVVLLANGRVS